MIRVPETNPNLPSHIYVSNLAKPKIQMRVDTENRNRITDPNVEMYIAWFNEIKKVKLEYKPRIDKFDAVTQFTKDVGNKFVVGLNIKMLKDKYVWCEFAHEPENAIPEDGTPTKMRYPSLTTSEYSWRVIDSDPLDLFMSKYHDLYYNMTQDIKSDDCFYMYNPEQIVKVQLIRDEDRIESLYIRKRYEEALAIIRNNYSKTFLSKLQ